MSMLLDMADPAAEAVSLFEKAMRHALTPATVAADESAELARSYGVGKSMISRLSA
jgi:hypothetical protein